ncbi:NAD-dependent epimerase/dehydratase family protein [uncultured Croceitalea sp.]|uniref:NAD-dependent epimerase/dehydratase family protein n=1 Tax=uncultured Croceitalea sp. TaxID=1798908 RepID=UPI0033061B8B
MKRTGKTAIILGATGLVGGILLELLVKDKLYKKIVLFSRRAVEIKHQKIEEHLCDLLELELQQEHFKADEVFCCIGSTNAKTPNNELYKRIDYGIPVAAAKLCVQNNINTLMIVSALGADANSSIFYNRIKGEMEDKVLEIKIPKMHIVQPSMIGGNRKEKRPREYFFKKMMQGLSFLFQGALKKYRVIHPETIAKSMVWLANNDFEKNRILSDELKQLSKHE